MFTANARQIQRNYRSLFNQTKRKKEPLFIMNGTVPEMVVLSVEMYEELLEKTGGESKDEGSKTVQGSSRFCTDLPWRRG